MVALLRIANLLSTSAHALSIRVNIKTECARLRQVPSLYMYFSSSKPVDFRAALVSGTIVQVRRQPVSSLSSLNTMVFEEWATCRAPSSGPNLVDSCASAITSG